MRFAKKKSHRVAKRNEVPKTCSKKSKKKIGWCEIGMVLPKTCTLMSLTCSTSSPRLSNEDGLQGPHSPLAASQCNLQLLSAHTRKEERIDLGTTTIFRFIKSLTKSIPSHFLVGILILNSIGPVITSTLGAPLQISHLLKPIYLHSSKQR